MRVHRKAMSFAYDNLQKLYVLWKLFTEDNFLAIEPNTLFLESG